MPGFADLDFCLSQLNDSGTMYGFQEHWFFTFGLSLDLGSYPDSSAGLVFLDFCFWFFFGSLDQVFVWILVFL